MTSALDSRTEAVVQESLERLMKGRTNFVIAHRLSTIMSADRIVVMDHGENVDIGTHAELVSRPGVYQNLNNEQFKSVQEALVALLLQPQTPIGLPREGGRWAFACFVLCAKSI